jgi:hypothetical protein
MQAQVRQTEQSRLPAESSDPSFDPTIRRGTPDPCPACLIPMLIPRRGTELGDRRQHAQQTGMIASHAESAGSLRSEAADTLRYDRWPRLSREIRRWLSERFAQTAHMIY